MGGFTRGGRPRERSINVVNPGDHLIYGALGADLRGSGHGVPVEGSDRAERGAMTYLGGRTLRAEKRASLWRGTRPARASRGPLGALRRERARIVRHPFRLADREGVATLRAVDAPEPEETLAADEPPTPMWLPALGAGLFVLALIWFVAF